MARLVRDNRIDNRTGRLKLAVQSEPYWAKLSEGEHLGYYRGSKQQKWVARYRVPGAGVAYKKVRLGDADDFADADGERTLNYKQATDAARAWFASQGAPPPPPPYTVGDAFDDYLIGFTGKSVAKTKARIEAILRPVFGDVLVAELTTAQIATWLREKAASPAKLRTSARADQQNKRAATSADAMKRRQSTANRDLTVLKAALNVAYRSGKAPSDDAWRKVKPFENVDAARMRYLDEAEAKRLVNACDPLFRPMVQAALLTGCRYGELASVKARDVDLAAGTVWLTDTKARKSRIAYLEAEGLRLFTAATAGKQGDALVFPRSDGKRWGPSQQARYLANACQNGNVDKTGFHDLRRTFGARLARRGVQMAVIAEALGDADERIVRKHYAHLSPSYLADTIRANVDGQGLVPASNVEVIGGAR